MSMRSAFNVGKVAKPPEGSPWVWLTDELLKSPAWSGQSLHCRRLIEFLMLEHMANAGTENGNLTAPYAQLVRFGLSRKFIPEAIREAEALRLIEVARGGKRNAVEDHLSRFRLTWLAARATDKSGPYYTSPGNEWQLTAVSELTAIKRARVDGRRKAKAPASKTRSRFPTWEPPRYPQGELDRFPQRAPRDYKTALSLGSQWGGTFLYLGLTEALLRQAMASERAAPRRAA